MWSAAGDGTRKAFIAPLDVCDFWQCKPRVYRMAEFDFLPGANFHTNTI